jgi:hypothetical protein
MNMKHIFPVITATIFAALLPATGRADSFNVSLNTSALSGTAQTLAFGLNDSDGSNNTLSLTGFNFGGGSALSGTQDCTLEGSLSGAGCSGDLTDGVTLTDSVSEVFFDQEFTAGSSLSFNMTTTNDYAGAIPDGFDMYLCSADLTSCYSDDASGAMLILGLTGAPLTPSSFTLFTASAQNLPAPVVTAVSATVPEPSSVFWLALLVLTAGALSPRVYYYSSVSLLPATIRGAVPWTAADALVGSPGLNEAHFATEERAQGDPRGGPGGLPHHRPTTRKRPQQPLGQDR